MEDKNKNENIVPAAPAVAAQPPVAAVPIQQNILWDIIGKMKELIQERGMKAALEQLEKEENQAIAVRAIKRLPPEAQKGVRNSLQAIVAQLPGTLGGRRKTHKRGGSNGAIQQLESNNSSYGGLSPATVMRGGNLGAVQQMIAGTPYSDQPITPNTVYRNPWGGRRRHTKRKHLRRRA